MAVRSTKMEIGMDARDEQELSRRRLEEEIQKNLETRLFQYYRNIGAIIVTVLGVFGYTVGWPAVQRLITDTINTQIRASVEQPVADARKAVDEFNAIINVKLPSLRSQTEAVHEALGRAHARTGEIVEQYGASHERIKSRQSELDVELKNAQATADALSQQLKYSTPTKQDIQQLATLVDALAKQTAHIATSVTQLQVATNSPVSPDTNLEKNLSDLKDKTGELTQVSIDRKAQAIVYVQFAGGSREDIKLVTANLREKGWSVPAEERTSNAAKQFEIRYFHTEDSSVASQLASDVNGALTAAGFANVSVSARDVSKNPNIKLPRGGVLELWIEIPLRK
jgi:prefoldin subunit 5